MRKLPEPPEAFEFGDVRLDLRRFAVTRAGRPVALEPKAFEVLRYLVEHRDRLVTKDELLDAVWTDVFVTPNVLTRSVAQLRKALGDEAQRPVYIETVSKRGYRFIGVVVAAPFDEVASSGGADRPAQADPRVEMRAAGWGRASGMTAIAVSAIVLAAAIWAGLGWLRASPAPAPLPVVQRLTGTGDVIHAVISRDGNYVAFVRSTGGTQSLWIRQRSAATEVQLVAPEPVSYWGITFAPDSASLYYVVKGRSAADDAAGTLYTIPVLPGPPPRKVLSGIDSAVTFAPDGRRFAYFRLEREPAGASALVIAGTAETPRVVATLSLPEVFVPVFFGTPAWSPDGSRIAAGIRNASTYESKLVTIDPEDGSQTILLADFGSVGYTAWTPDGAGVLFVGQPLREWSSPPQIWLQSLEGGPVRKVTADTVEYRSVSVTDGPGTIVAVATDHLSSLWAAEMEGEGGVARIPSVRSDGIGGIVAHAERLFFTSLQSGDPQLWTMNRDGSDRRQLTTEGWNSWPAVSSDGRTVYFIRHLMAPRGANPGIWRMDADSRNARQLAEIGMAATNLHLSEDQQWLYYTSDVAGVRSCWRIPAQGGAPSPVVTGLASATPSPDGRFVAGLWRPTPHSPPLLAVFAADGGPPLHQYSGNFTVGEFESMHWSRDSTALLYTTTERTNVWRRALGGGEPQQLTNFEDGVVFSFAPAADRGLILSRGPSIRDAFVIDVAGMTD